MTPFLFAKTLQGDAINEFIKTFGASHAVLR